MDDVVEETTENMAECSLANKHSNQYSPSIEQKIEGGPTVIYSKASQAESTQIRNNSRNG